MRMPSFQRLISPSAKALLRRFEVESNWQLLPTARAGSSKDFLIGGYESEEGRKMSYRFWVDKSKRRMKGLVHYGTHTQGPKGSAHGGSTASVLDVASGSLLWWLGEICVTGELIVRYKRLIPLGSTLLIDAQVTTSSNKKIQVSASLCDVNVDGDYEKTGGGGGGGDKEKQDTKNDVYAASTCTFIRIDPSKVGWGGKAGVGARG